MPNEFPELQKLTAAELAAVLIDEAKYRQLVDTIVANSHVSQVGAQTLHTVIRQPD